MVSKFAGGSLDVNQDVHIGIDDLLSKVTMVQKNCNSKMKVSVV